MKKNELGAAIASTVMMVSMGVSISAYAASPALTKVVPVVLPAADPDAGARVIVKYRASMTASTYNTDKLQRVQSAALRANVAQSGTAKTGTALTAGYVRRLGSGADAIKLSRKLSAMEMASLVREIAADAMVEHAQVDRRLTRLSTPNDPYYAAYQWHYSNANGGINAPAAWDVSTGKGVVVAVLDTGVLTAHPDMGANLLSGYDFITDSFVSRRATSERVAGAQDYGDWTDGTEGCGTATSSSWHGTHTTGTVAEVTNNSVGLAGVAYNAKVLPIRVLGRCGGYASDIADAIIWASGGSISGVPANANPAEVINLSLGGSGSCDSETQAAINTAVANGSVVVVAAGNSAANAANFTPASCANVISVGANGITGGKAPYSNYGPVVDISAPGGGVNDGASTAENYVWQAGYSGATTPTSGAYGYTGMVGTSMAAPHVAAVAALVQSALIGAGKSPLTPAAMETLLKGTARAFPVVIPANTPIGTGIVNAAAALTTALQKPCNPAVETCGPVATELVNKVNVTGLSGATNSSTLYSFKASAGSVLTFLTYGGTGNVSLYVSYGKEPGTTAYDFSSARAGNNEQIRITAPLAGTYYIKLVGAAAYSGVTLVARQ